TPGVQVMGTHNLFFSIQVDAADQRLVDDERGGPQRLLTFTHVVSNFQIDPGRRFSRIGWFFDAGQQLAFSGARKGTGADVLLFGTLKPPVHLALDFNAERQWVDLDDAGAKGRLFTAPIERLKATYNFSAAPSCA